MYEQIPDGGRPAVLDRRTGPDLAAKPLADWADVFDREPDFFWSPVNSLEDVLADEQFHAGGGIVDVPDGDGVIPMVATTADFHGTPWEPR